MSNSVISKFRLSRMSKNVLILPKSMKISDGPLLTTEDETNLRIQHYMCCLQCKQNIIFFQTRTTLKCTTT